MAMRTLKGKLGGKREFTVPDKAIRRIEREGWLMPEGHRARAARRYVSRMRRRADRAAVAEGLASGS